MRPLNNPLATLAASICMAIFVALPVPAHAAKSVQDIAVGAAIDDPTDLYNLGVEFYTGRTVHKDLSKSAKQWQKASDLGVVTAKNNLGFLLFNGFGIKQDRARAVRLWGDAADLGQDESQWHLGMAVFDGSGLKKDRTVGAAWVLCAYHSAVVLKDDALIKLTSKSSTDLMHALTDMERRDAVRLAESFEKRHAPQGL